MHVAVLYLTDVFPVKMYASELYPTIVFFTILYIGFLVKKHVCYQIVSCRSILYYTSILQMYFLSKCMLSIRSIFLVHAAVLYPTDVFPVKMYASELYPTIVFFTIL